MKLGGTAALVAALGSLLGSTGEATAAKYKAWALEVEAGVKADDRVTVDEVDASATGDVAAVLGLDASYRLVDEDDGGIEVGYEFNQTLYQDLTAFDYQRHSPTLSAWVRTANGVKLAFGYAYTRALLGGSFFLDQHVLSPSLSTFVSDATQVTMFYRFTDKNYADDTRDGQTHEAGVDVHYYFDKADKGYVMLGASFVSEDTTSDAFVYSGPSAHAALQVPIEAFGQPGKLKFSYTYQRRNYDNPTSLTPPTGDTRRDDRQTLRAYGELEVVDGLKATAEYRFTDRSSNLATADYAKNVATLGMKYGFW